MSKIHEILHKIQQNLKAPKDKYNSFGEYSYRSQQQILERVKPLLPDGIIITLSDEVREVAGNAYIYATATISGEVGAISCSAGAREDKERKKMQPEQLTGSSSSYARKYALMGLLAIDDTKDADTDEHKNEVIQGGVLDTQTRDDAKLEFLKQVNGKLDNINSLSDLDNALTTEEKNYLKNKLQKIDPVAYKVFRDRYIKIETQLKKIAEEELLNEFHRA